MTSSQSVSSEPILIQGGMGIAISNWNLARVVSERGHLGVVSGTAIDRVIAYRLQEGDVDGNVRRVLDTFPCQEFANRVFDHWYKPEGLSEAGDYKPVPMFNEAPRRQLLELAVIAGFVEVALAKEGHDGVVGINLLEKIQAPTLPLLYGAILAGVDYVLMGAGIPRDIPMHLDRLRKHEDSSLKLSVDGGDDIEVPFSPKELGLSFPECKRPKFLAIVSSHVLAMSLARSGGVDGFIVEGPVAGGHNAGPRGWSPTSNEEPTYSARDEVNLDRIIKLGLPFWLAGGMDHPEAIIEAQEKGAVGIQVGTAFAFCSDSGMEPSVRKRAIAAALAENLNTKTEGRGSPTGFPFKTLDLEGTEGARDANLRERQTCMHGYLRSAFKKEDGSLGWRCAAEPMKDYVRKGGESVESPDRRCLCNGLLATAGHAQSMKGGGIELPLVTSGTIRFVERFMGEKDDYDANDVIDSFKLASVAVS